jgi:hypothetical protein
MTVRRFGHYFPRIFTAAFFTEMAFALFIHFPGYLNGLGATEGLIGVLYAVSAIIGLSLRPALGRILDRVHRRSVRMLAKTFRMLRCSRQRASKHAPTAPPPFEAAPRRLRVRTLWDCTKVPHAEV